MTDDFFKSFDFNNIEFLTIASERVSFKFKDNNLFNNLSFKIKSRGITIFMGPNGSGKTVCLKLIAGLLKPSSGNLCFTKKVKIGYVSQKTILLRRNVYQNLLYALKISNYPKNEIKKRIDNALLISGLKDFSFFSARKLSIGQQQLLAIMRALIIRPNLLLLDEPCSNLDPQSSKVIEKILENVSSVGVKVILVTHDILQAKRLADEILFIHKGEILEHTNKKKFFSSPDTELANNYIQGMLLR